MKKNLRSKILLCVLAGGVLAANTALAAKVYTETISGANDNYGTKIKTDESNGIYKYNFGENAELNVNNENFAIFINENNKNDVNEIVINTPLDIYLTNNTQIHGTYGIYIDDNTGADISGKVIDRSGGGIIKVVSDKRELNENSGTIVRGVGVLSGNNNIVKIGNATVIVDAVYDENFFADASGLYAQNTDNEIIMDGGTIEVTADVNDGTNSAQATGVSAFSGSKITIGNTDIKATAFSNNKAYADGIYVYKGANIKHENGKIEVVAQGANVLMARGLTLDTDGATANLGIVDISAKTIGGSNANSFGVWTINESTANIAGGSITAKAYNSDGISENKDAYVAAILSEDTSAINVNHGATNDVVINGDILTFDNSTVNLNLNTINSEINGAIYKGSTNGTNLTLANGAEWNVGGNYNSNITNLDMNGGIINQNTSKYIDIENYSGSGYINFTAKNTDNDGVLDFANTGDVTIESAEAGSSVNLGVINNTVNTLDIDKTEENLNALAQKLTYKGSDSNLSGKVTIKEGLIIPEVSGDLLFDSNNKNRGYVANVKQNSSTTTIDNIKNIAATAIVAWRQEDSTLSQRLGELRESDGGQGIWVRMSRGEFEYDGEYKNQYNFFQMGYDWAAGSWHYGAAVSHNDGQTTYTHGDGENRSTSLSLYGTWLGDKGHYADIVLKQGRLSNDFDIYTEAGHTSGDYDAWGTSLSGEYGMKVDLDGGWYVTPQAQFTLMRIGGEDYTTNNGIKVNQDSLESAVGRVGFEVGKRISDSGSIYAKASLLHDFAGSADTYLSHKGLTNSYHQDIGDTWCEAGIGFNYKTSENSYVYADVVKTFGGDVETPWQWNAGMRWTF